MKKAISFLLTLCMLLTLAVFGTGTAFAAEPAVEESVMGSREGNEYVSELLGIRATFSEDWHLLDEEEIAELMGYTADLITDETLSDALRESGSVCDLYAVRSDGSGDNLNVQLEDLGKLYGSFLSEEAYLSIALPKLEEALGNLDIQDLALERQEFDFAGDTRQSVLITGSSGGVAFVERMIFLKSGQYMASLTAFSTDSARLDEMLAVFEALDEQVDTADALGEKQGNRYESELLGIAVDFPENWYILSPEETAQAMGAVADTINDETLADQLRQAGSTCDLYAIALDESGDNLNIQLEDLGYLYGVLLTPKEYAEIALPQLKPALEQVGFTNVQIETENYEFAGRDRVSLLVTAEMNGVPVLERMILIKSGQYMASITVFSTDAERVDALLGQFVEF